MFKRSFYFLLLAGSVLSAPVKALSSQGNTSTQHTYTYYSLELKPAFTQISYQTAAVCFLGFGNCNSDAKFSKDDEDKTLDTQKQCANEGFTITSCTVPQYAGKACSYDKRFFASCITDNPRACREAGYVNTCGSGEKLSEKDRCPWDNSFGKCCSLCPGYDYKESEIPSGYIADGQGCNSCSGLKYRIKINPCTGYKDCDLGGEVGAQTCMSGTVKKFSSCKSCPSNCFDTCPTGANCFKCNGRYCIASCMSGFWSYENYYCNNALKCLLPKN